jgi:hypothetical protein
LEEDAKPKRQTAKQKAMKEATEEISKKRKGVPTESDKLLNTNWFFF